MSSSPGRSSNRAAVVILIGMTVLIGSAIVVLIVGARGAHARRASAAVARGPRFHQRGLMDTSGFTSVCQSFSPWRPDSTLTELSTIWHDVGHRNIAQIDGILSDSARSPVERLKLLMTKATFLNYEGDSRAAPTQATARKSRPPSRKAIRRLPSQRCIRSSFSRGSPRCDAARQITA